MALTLSVEATVRNVRIDFTAPAGAASVTITRVGPSGTPAIVRGWDATTIVAGAVIARDFEAPIGVPLTYTAVTKNASGTVIDTQTGTITITSQGCSDTWLNDLARAANTLQVVIESLPELEFPVPTTVHEIITRRSPIVTSDIAHLPAFELSFLTEELGERDQARAILGNGVPVLLRTPPEDGIGNLYMSVLGYSEQRLVTAGVVPARRFVVQGRQIDRPDPALYEPLGVATYAHVKSAWASYSALRDGRANYDAVLYDWSGSAPSDIVPWPPADV